MRVRRAHWSYVAEADLVRHLEEIARSGHTIISVQRTRRWLWSCYLVVTMEHRTLRQSVRQPEGKVV